VTELTLAPEAPMLHEPMTFGHAIDLFIADMRAEGRINSAATERSYQDCLSLHADDVGNRDPRSTFRQDVKTTLRRWPNPNTQRVRRGCLVSFYDWTMQELEPPRDYNPARQTRPPRKRKSTVYRMTRQEAAAHARRAHPARAADRVPRCRRRHPARRTPGVAGQALPAVGLHLDQRGHRQGRTRAMDSRARRPVPLVEEIRSSVSVDEYVIPAERRRDPGVNKTKAELKKRPGSRQAFRTVVETLGKRAGI
jgi:hypothetical protein